MTEGLIGAERRSTGRARSVGRAHRRRGAARVAQARARVVAGLLDLRSVARAIERRAAADVLRGVAMTDDAVCSAVAKRAVGVDDIALQVVLFEAAVVVTQRGALALELERLRAHLDVTRGGLRAVMARAREPIAALGRAALRTRRRRTADRRLRDAGTSARTNLVDQLRISVARQRGASAGVAICARTNNAVVAGRSGAEETADIVDSAFLYRESAVGRAEVVAIRARALLANDVVGTEVERSAVDAAALGVIRWTRERRHARIDDGDVVRMRRRTANDENAEHEQEESDAHPRSVPRQERC